jgi:hypothetical protein
MKIIFSILILSSIFSYGTLYTGSTTGAVTIAGAIIKAQNMDNDTNHKKYKRKDCPVCKGKGWYMSGDGIKKIDCSYCEPDSTNVLKADSNQCNTRIQKR